MNIAKGTGRDAPGGAMDRRDGPGPGEFWPDEDPAAPAGDPREGYRSESRPSPRGPAPKNLRLRGRASTRGRSSGAPDARAGTHDPEGQAAGSGA